MKKYLLSLDKDHQRREIFFQQENTTEFEVISAINTLTLDKEALKLNFSLEKFKKKYLRDVSSGEIGCTLSHLSIYRKIVDDDSIQENEVSLICEDDVLFSDDFHQVLTAIETDLNLPNYIDILLLGESKINFLESKNLEIIAPISFNWLSKKIANLPYRYGLPSHYHYEGTVCYIIKKSAARKIIQFLEKQLPYWLADDFAFYTDEIKLSVNMLRPIIAIENPNLESNLEKKRNNLSKKRVKTLEKTRYYLKYPIKKCIAVIKNIIS